MRDWSVQPCQPVRYFLASPTRWEKGFSQQYILITLIPLTISFIRRILLSVLLAVCTLSRPNCLPTQAVRKVKRAGGDKNIPYFAEEQQRSVERLPPEHWGRSSDRGGRWWWSAGEGRPTGSGWTGRSCRTCSRRLTEGSPSGPPWSDPGRCWRASALSCRGGSSRPLWASCRCASLRRNNCGEWRCRAPPWPPHRQRRGKPQSGLPGC